MNDSRLTPPDTDKFVLLMQRCKSSGETGWERLQTRDLYSNYKSSTKVLLQSSSCLFSFPQKWPPLRTYLFLPLQSSFHVQYCLSCEATHALCIEIMDTIFDEYAIVYQSAYSKGTSSNIRDRYKMDWIYRTNCLQKLRPKFCNCSLQSM